MQNAAARARPTNAPPPARPSVKACGSVSSSSLSLVELGRTVGKGTGSPDGKGNGPAVGARVGTDDGAGTGAVVGSGCGTAVGSGTGLLGLLVGIRVGNFDGAGFGPSQKPHDKSHSPLLEHVGQY